MVEINRSSKNKANLPLAGKTEQKLLSELLLNQSFSLLKFGENFLAWPTTLLSELDQLKANLRIVHAGIKVGEIIRECIIPAHELAVSTICNGSHFPQLELSLDQALGYLKRDDFQLGFKEKGWNLLTYGNLPLGWAKNIGNRFNNIYPKEWRIRMSTSEFNGEKLHEEASKFPLKL